MVSSEVQRTLVKSPPELWAELSDPVALARHLGELGEIRITKVKPEERVEWEADGISGTVLIKASGWGTKVTLSVTRETEESTEPDLENPSVEVAVQMEPTVEPPAAAETASAVLETRAEPEPSPKQEVDPEPAIEPRRGFFSRLFRRRTQPISEPEPRATAEPEPQPMDVDELAPPPAEIAEPAREPEPTASGIPSQAIVEDLSGAPANIAAELKAAEEIDEEKVTALLNAVLDRLGAAHHRPFSRA